MRFFVRKKFFFMFFLVVVFSACSVLEAPESESTRTFLPDNEAFFPLIANDGATSDSVDAMLAHGVKFRVHPNAHYELSFDVDEYAPAPRLQLFRVYKLKNRDGYSASLVHTLKPEVIDGRYVFSFDCEENSINYWLTSLNDGKNYYDGTTRNVRLEGYGSYSDHLSLNLIVAGKMKDLDVSYDSLATILKKQFKRFYTNITLDTVYIRMASDHPEYGAKYASTFWIAGKSSDDVMLSELGGWPETKVRNALDIILVYQFKTDGLLGLSDLFGANLGGGDGSTVVVANHVVGLGTSEVQPVPADSIVLTALHEMGHFFGLRHTTATSADQKSGGDYSIYDDGFSDTPNCFSKSMRRAISSEDAEIPTDYRVPDHQYVFRAKYSASVSTCPDASNLMFPTETDVEYTGFSSQQLRVIRQNLMMMPH